VPDTSSQLSDKSMQSDDAVEDEYETFDPHLFVSRQLIVRHVFFPWDPPLGGWGGSGSGKLEGGQLGKLSVVTKRGLASGRFPLARRRLLPLYRLRYR
jgi:hypothetical protein